MRNYRHNTCLAALLLLCLLFQTSAPFPIASAHAQAQPSCPNLPQNPPGPDFSNKDLSGMNFSRRDLRMANFTGATLKGTVFIGADLSGANFTGARVLASEREDLRPTDFSNAKLSNACFANMRFGGRTYFTYADISCADFSNNNLSGELAIFGPSPLKIDAGSSCRPAFRGTVMHCEFIADWPKLDLGAGNGSTGADLSACGTALAGLRFDGANLAGVNLSGANLDGASLAGANLARAKLDNASLQCTAQQCVDLQNANLQSASLIGANLSGANLHQAVLSAEPGKPAANLSRAHLRNVNLSQAQLTGVNFSGANFYGTYAGKCNTRQAGHNGATVDCASAYGATMTETVFDNAYLYGVDFSTASITGASFNGAVLTGAEFGGATIGTSANGKRTSFLQAHLQGTNLDRAAALREADLTGAYVDFRARGNQLYLNLAGNAYNRHACGAGGCTPAAGMDVCVWLSYTDTTVPTSNSSIICPDGNPAGSNGCGRATPDGSNLRWKSSQPMTTPQGWYVNVASYAPAAAPASVCNGRGANGAVVNW